MFKFLSRDPVKKAKKHVEKALGELEDGYPDYASIEFEKAAKLFLEGEGPVFAVKYFREAASCALQNKSSISVKRPPVLCRTMTIQGRR
jgi:hypothetical protein